MIENFHKLHIDVGRDLVKLYVIYGEGVPCLQRVSALTLLNRPRTHLNFDASVDTDTWCE